MKIVGEQNQRKYWRNSKTYILNFTRNSLTLVDSMNNFHNGANNGKQCLSKKFNRIESFMQNKTSGNDGPTAEF
mgnify:FL=1